MNSELLIFKGFVTLIAISELVSVFADRLAKPNSFTVPSLIVNSIINAWVIWFVWAKIQ